MRKARLDAGARGGRAFGHPGVPDGVHAVVVGHRGQVEGDVQEARLVAAGLGQRGVDPGEDFARLGGDVGVGGVRHFDEVEGVAVDDDVGIAARRAEAFDVHAVVLKVRH